MKECWWRSPLAGFDVSVAAQGLRLNPYDPQFAALHHIGEGYDCRDPERKGSLLLERMRQANTLKALAQVYDRPVVEFQRLNPSWLIDQPLDQETWVYVPDSEFAPLLAARF